MQDAELNSDAHQADSGHETYLDLHGLCNGKLNVVIIKLGKEPPEAEIPNIKLNNKFSIWMIRMKGMTILTSFSPAVEKQSTPRMTAVEPTMAVETRMT